jgi:hypothetical protein
MEYKIVTHTSYGNLEIEVNTYTKGGWKPVGGITIQDNTKEMDKKSSDFDDIDIRYFQVIVK